MIKFDTQKVVLLDEIGEDADNNKFRNETAIGRLKQKEQSVSHINTGNLCPRVLVTGKVNTDTTIEDLQFHPMEHFNPSLEQAFWDALLSRK